MNVATRTTSTAAVVSLVTGIASWVVLPVIGAIVAIVAGHIARGDIRNARGALDGDGLAVAGLVLGYVHLAFMAAAVMVVVLFFGGLAVLASTGAL
jgi:hypothetical protein